tara:strand:+ start:454 stop:2337 length:1884 start_codon:yes stop_codon:yes gene_type:complete
MKRNIIIITLSIVFLTILTLKSSKLEFDYKYPNLKVETNSGFIISSNVITFFTDEFQLNISADGYENLIFDGTHADGVNRIKLNKLPIELNLSQLEQYPKFIRINGIVQNLNDTKIMEGLNTVYMEFDNFLPITKEIIIGTELNYVFKEDLKEITKEINFINITLNDEIYLNNSLVSMPNNLILKNHENLIKVIRNGDTIYDSTLIVSNNTSESIVLEREEKVLAIKYSQNNTDIYVNGAYKGNLLNEIPKPKDGDIITFAQKNFYPLDITYSGQDQVKVNLKKIFGSLIVENDQEAILKIDNSKNFSFNKNYQIQTGQHTVEISKQGYETLKINIEIDEGKLIKISRKLLTIKEATIRDSKESIINSIGVKLNLNKPGKIIIGSDTSEFRRSKNEISRKINLTRHFYLSETHITNEQYSKLMGTKSNDNEPVTKITWLQAAQFCNKLSVKEGFKEFYVIQKDKLIGFNISSLGYRLPSESEWEYVISEPTTNGQKTKTYPWGNEEELNESYGNLSDMNSTNTNFISNYVDAHVKLAPVKSYPRSKNNYYDFLGNVREWVNDFYSEEMSLTDKKFIDDYLGPNLGQTHVIKGSSYLSFNLNQMGISYRNKSNFGLDDVGFRVARWIY